MTFRLGLDISASGDVTWGPDPEDVAAVAEAIAPLLADDDAADEIARAALETMHERTGEP